MATKKTTAKPAAKRAPVKTGVRRVALVGVNPAAKKRRITSDEFEVCYSPDGKKWHRWSVYSYEPMAKEVAKRLSKEHPSYYVRVEKIK